MIRTATDAAHERAATEAARNLTWAQRHLAEALVYVERDLGPAMLSAKIHLAMECLQAVDKALVAKALLAGNARPAA